MRRMIIIEAFALAFAILLSVPPAVGAVGSPTPPHPDPGAAAIAAGDRLIATDPARIHRSPKDKIIRRGLVAGARGLHYVRYERAHAGLPVRGGDFVVVTDFAGRMLSVSMSQRQELSVSTEPTLSAGAAASTARGRLKKVNGNSEPRLVVLADGAGKLVYETVVNGYREDRPSRLHVYVDGRTGDVAGSWDEIFTGTGHGFYQGTVPIDTTRSATKFGMSDPIRPGVRCGGLDGRTYTDLDDVWGVGTGTDLVTACVDAMYEAQRGWDMLRTWFGRNGFDGNGRGFPMRVGSDIVNAFWEGTFAQFGHNQARTRQATPTDVVMHELGHAIYQHTPGGPGIDISGAAMNESSADIFGTLTEWYSTGSHALDPPDYLAAEELDFVGTGAIRAMFNPSIYGDPNCYDSSIVGGEPHWAAGPQNHWFYLLAEGSHANDPAHGRPNSPTCNGSAITGIGIQKAGLIFMEGLNRKTERWHWFLARVATLEAALQLFPNDCNIFNTVRAAWNAINVPRHSAFPEPASCP